MRSEQLEHSLSKLFPERQRQVGNWGQKGWKSLVALDNPSRCLFWESVVLPGRLPQATIVASGFSMSRNPKPTKKAEALLKKEPTSGVISVTKLEWVRITSSH